MKGPYDGSYSSNAGGSPQILVLCPECAAKELAAGRVGRLIY